MKTRQIFFVAAAIVFSIVGTFMAVAQPSNPAPDNSHANEPLLDGIIAWDALTKTTDATNGQDYARFIFSFTNSGTSAVTILNVHPSCGCTTAELPPVPWMIPAGSAG
jgi:hypothetical protein